MAKKINDKIKFAKRDNISRIKTKKTINNNIEI